MILKRKKDSLALLHYFIIINILIVLPYLYSYYSHASYYYILYFNSNPYPSENKINPKGFQIDTTIKKSPVNLFKHFSSSLFSNSTVI